ncbi:MAG: hypothetical protein KAJ05_05950, partial [Candidatus Latescibacteria bacterium]|nr:hypothetical protein [Candidatus Latescibacterota bacterium]MCK5526673.1 hypothetical protein [Candidatus Latescibacterota bacterium]
PIERESTSHFPTFFPLFFPPQRSKALKFGAEIGSLPFVLSGYPIFSLALRGKMCYLSTRVGGGRPLF